MLDRYQITEQLGEGGAGSVFKAWDLKLKRYVALKHLLPPEQRADSGPGLNLIDEAAALSSLQHPHIVSIYDLDTDGSDPFVVMEFLNGETVEQTIRRGALMEEDFEKVVLETLDGLGAAHKAGLAHRDIKPGNIMFHWLEGDGGFILKLLDFGLANHGARLSQQSTGEGGTVAGSVHFMAPEQFLHQPIDFRADLYSLGCVFYYALTASFPYGGATVEDITRSHLSHQVMPLGELRPELPSLLTDWVMWLMSRQPEERPESAAEALRIFRGIRDGSITALPGRRMLKTHTLPVPGTGAASVPVGQTGPVVEAPLGRDAARRMDAARSSGSSEPVAPATRPAVRAAASTEASPARHSTAQPVADEAELPERKKSPLIPILAGLALLAGGAAAWHFLGAGDGRTAGPGTGGGAPASPPDSGLVIWLDAAQGTMRNAGKSAAKNGEPVDQWNDRAALGGNNPAQYHSSKSREAEEASRWPLLAAASGDGLAASQPVLNFAGEKVLVAARDTTLVGDAATAAFSSESRSWFAVINPSRAESNEQPVIEGNHVRQGRAFGLWIKHGKLRNGGFMDKTAQYSEIEMPASGFFITGGVWDGKAGSLQSFLITPDGTVTSGKPLSARLVDNRIESIRLGQSKGSPAAPGTTFLNGHLATVLIYNRALDDTARKALFTYLCRRYFDTPLKN